MQQYKAGYIEPGTEVTFKRPGVEDEQECLAIVIQSCIEVSSPKVAQEFQATVIQPGTEISSQRSGLEEKQRTEIEIHKATEGLSQRRDKHLSPVPQPSTKVASIIQEPLPHIPKPKRSKSQKF